MKPLEIFSALAADAAGASLPASPDAILASPAFAMPCRLGEESAVLRPAPVEPAESEMLALSVAFGEEPHSLRVARSAAFPDLDKLWDSRADVPEPVLLALVERECGPLLQLLENAVRKQLRLVGLSELEGEDFNAESQSRGSGSMNPLRLCVSALNHAENQEMPIVFSLSRSTAVVSAFGALRNLDLAHESIRSVAFPAETEYAAFALPVDDLASIAPGDALLLPEIGAGPPRLIVAERLSADESGVAPYQEDALVRVRAAEARQITLGELLDAAEELKVEKLKVESYKGEGCHDGLRLRLVRGGKTVADGRLGRLGEHPAFIVEALG